MANNPWVPFQGEKVIPLRPRRSVGKRNAQPERDLVHLPLMNRIRQNVYLSEHTLHIANERHTTPWYGAILKAMGVMRYASDLFIAIPTTRYSGFWIELKAPGERPNAGQQQFLDKMRSVGYAADWFDNVDKAWQAIMIYLGSDDLCA